jgi:hypothetical protein
MNTAPRSLSSHFVTVALVLFLTVAVALMAKKAFAGDVLLETFKSTHAEIMSKVEEGKLDGEVGLKASELDLGLQKYLIKADAQMEILELDVLHGSVEKRKAALQKIVALSAERERIMMGYLQHLQALTESKEGLLPLLPVEPEQSTAKEATGEEKTAKKKQDDGVWGTISSKWKGMEVIIGPENVDNGTP